MTGGEAGDLDLARSHLQRRPLLAAALRQAAAAPLPQRTLAAAVAMVIGSGGSRWRAAAGSGMPAPARRHGVAQSAGLGNEGAADAAEGVGGGAGKSRQVGAAASLSGQLLALLSAGERAVTLATELSDPS